MSVNLVKLNSSDIGRKTNNILLIYFFANGINVFFRMPYKKNIYRICAETCPVKYFFGKCVKNRNINKVRSVRASFPVLLAFMRRMKPAAAGKKFSLQGAFMYFNLAVYSVIFGIFYTLLFLLLQKSRILKITFAGLFFFTAVIYFLLTLLMKKYVSI